MRGLIAFVMAIVFGAAQCVAAPLSVCQHADGAAHQAALDSGDAAVAAVAHHEEAAAAAAEKQGSSVDQGANGLVSMLVPGRPGFSAPPAVASPTLRPGLAAWSPGRIVDPLLRPPLA